jgi:GT2 family glycosyltransferase
MSVFPTSRRSRSGSLTPGGDRNRSAVAVAMAMFDREQLIKIGGYDNELYKLGWFGWEDYDLWLRIAAAGLRVSFLPNVLCLYRHHDKAMSNTTNLFERELVAHLFEKHRALIERYSPKRRILGVNRSQFEQTTETSVHGFKRAEVYLAQVK